MSHTYKFQGRSFNYSCEVEEVYGYFPVVVGGNAYPVMVALVDSKKLKLDPGNPRLWAKGKKDAKRFNFSANGQKQLMEALAFGEFERPTDRLKQAMEANGGQNEALWVHCQGGKPKIVEGNRRFTSGTALGWVTMLVQIFPDEMPGEAVFDMVAQRHVSGILDWPSAVRSEAAYRYMVERHMTVKEITVKMQFQTESDTERYIHSYVWLKESGLPAKDWSKMHHAYRPILTKYFGYDKDHWRNGTAPFKKELRGRFFKDQAEVAVIDDLIAKAAIKAKSPINTEFGFQWFIQLIHDKKLTDCRQCDGIIGPIIHHADAFYGPEVLKILQTKPRKTTVKGEDGHGTPDPDVPAQMAQNYYRQVRSASNMSRKVEELVTEFQSTLKSVSKMGRYTTPCSENEIIATQVDSLIVLAKAFRNKMSPIIEDVTAA